MHNTNTILLYWVNFYFMQVLLSRVGFFGSKDNSNSEHVQNYRKTAEAIMCNILPKSPKASDSRTDGNIHSAELFIELGS